MDAAQREHWAAKGWIVVPSVLSPELLSAANELYDDHLYGEASAHPDDTPWDPATELFTHSWYNTGQVRTCPVQFPHAQLNSSPDFSSILALFIV